MKEQFEKIQRPNNTAKGETNIMRLQNLSDENASRCGKGLILLGSWIVEVLFC